MKFLNKIIPPSKKSKYHEVIFEADTPKGKLFDILLIVLILASVTIVMLETVDRYDNQYHTLFKVLEWVFTIIFTIEYLLRLHVTKRPLNYAISFFGIIDLLAILPTYIGLFLVGSSFESLLVIRALRLLRVFRVLKMVSFLKHGKIIMLALKQSAPKILVFLFFILIIVMIFGSVMYVVEGATNDKFSSIPESIYWAIVTLTTVGYGDISPTTPLGKFLASSIMIIGYAIIAVPTGIMTAELLDAELEGEEISTQVCQYCSTEGHHENAKFCRTCGELLNPEPESDDEDDGETDINTDIDNDLNTMSR